MKKAKLSDIVYYMPSHAVGMVSSINKDQSNNLATFEQVMCLSRAPSRIIICLTKQTNTYENIINNKEFVLFFPTIDYIKNAYIAGSKELDNKTEVSNFTFKNSEMVKAMSVNEIETNFECVFNKVIEDVGDHVILIGDVINITTSEEIINKSKLERRSSLKSAYYITDGKFFEQGKIKDIK